MKSKRILIILGVIVIVILIISSLLHWIVSPFYDNQIEVIEKDIVKDNTTVIEITEEEIEEEISKAETVVSDEIIKEEVKADEIINILLCGLDARKYDTKSRSDTIILASYNKTQHKVKLVSFMRDSWVHIPEHGWSRINAATVYGGTGLLINTINHNFDLDIQNYIQIKFDDFKDVIDILGGVDVELTQAEIDYINNKLHVEDEDWENNITDKPGIVHLNGAQALWHCRNRSIGNSDFERTNRQREVLTILIDKATNMKIGQATSIVFELREHVNTNIDMETLINLGYDILIGGNIEVETTRIPFDDEYWGANKNGASVLELDIEENTRLLHQFLGYNTEEINEDDEMGGEIKGDDTEDTMATEGA